MSHPLPCEPLSAALRREARFRLPRHAQVGSLAGAACVLKDNARVLQGSSEWTEPSRRAQELMLPLIHGV